MSNIKGLALYCKSNLEISKKPLAADNIIGDLPYLSQIFASALFFNKIFTHSKFPRKEAMNKGV